MRVKYAVHTLRLDVRVGVRLASLRNLKRRMDIWSRRPVLSTFGVGCAVRWWKERWISPRRSRWSFVVAIDGSMV